MKLIRNIVLVTTVLVLNSAGFAQKQTDGKSEFFRIPADLAFTLVANRVDSPIVVETAELYTTTNANRVLCKCRIRNIGEKAISSIDVDIITNFLFRPEGGGRLERFQDLLGFDNSKKYPFLLPKAAAWSREYLSLTKKVLPDDVILRIRRQPSQVKAKFIVAIVVGRVEFTDGTIYDASSDEDDLEKLFINSLEAR